MRHQKTPMQSQPTLDIHLGYWLRLVSNHVSGNFARALQERSVSVAEWVALNQIQGGTDMTPARLAWGDLEGAGQAAGKAMDRPDDE
jgi:hypothetical protein